MNNLLAQNSTCFHANTLIYLYYGKGANHLTRDFLLDSLKFSKAIFLYAERALGCITEKDPSNHFKFLL